MSASFQHFYVTLTFQKLETIWPFVVWRSVVHRWPAEKKFCFSAKKLRKMIYRLQLFWFSFLSFKYGHYNIFNLRQEYNSFVLFCILHKINWNRYLLIHTIIRFRVKGSLLWRRRRRSFGVGRFWRISAFRCSQAIRNLFQNAEIP